MSKWGFIFEDEPEEDIASLSADEALTDDTLYEFVEFLVEEEPWKDYAACKGVGWQLFFLERGQSPRIGKRLCSVCPVTEECWDYANRTSSEGIWAGRTRDPREVSKGHYMNNTPVQMQDARPRRVI